MSMIYELVEDDDIRTLRLQLISTPTPVSATLIMKKDAVTIERELVSSGAYWTYRFLDADFLELVKGNWKAWVYATFSDGTNGTYPTRGYIQIKVYLK